MKNKISVQIIMILREVLSSPSWKNAFDDIMAIIETLYSHMQIHAEHNNNDRHSLLEKYIPLTLLKGFEKVLLWEGVGDRTELQHIDPHSYGHQRCVFLVVQGCLTGGPWAHSARCGLSLLHLVTNGSPNSIGGPKGPFCWVVVFPTTSCL